MPLAAVGAALPNAIGNLEFLPDPLPFSCFSFQHQYLPLGHHVDLGTSLAFHAIPPGHNAASTSNFARAFLGAGGLCADRLHVAAGTCRVGVVKVTDNSRIRLSTIGVFVC